MNLNCEFCTYNEDPISDHSQFFKKNVILDAINDEISDR